MEAVQNNTFHTKMPGHVEGTKVAGALALAAVAYFAKCHLLAIVCLTSVRLSHRLGETPINALPEVSLDKVKVLQIATLVSLLVCSFKGYHRAVAGIYTLSALKIASDYFLDRDQMIAQIFDRVGGDEPFSNLPEVQFNPELGVRENVENSQDGLDKGWSFFRVSDGRRVFLHKAIEEINDKDITVTTAFVEKFSVLDMSNSPNITSHSKSMLLSLGIITLAVAVLNKDTNDEHHSLGYSRTDGGKMLTITGRF